MYRDHERLLNEHRVQQEQLRHHANTVRDSQQANDTLNAQLRQLLTEQAVLRDRVKPYLLQHRNDRRQLREQSQQLDALRALLSQFTPFV
ncbi:hypothetical protein D3C71_2042760 [compost metagenome]